MRILRPPGLGPIVGHTSDTTARLWIRAGDPTDDDGALNENRRTVGVLAILAKDGKKVNGAPVYFRLHREFDRTGTFEIGTDENMWDGKPLPPLEPDTLYTVGLASLTIDDPNGNDENIPDEQVRKWLPKPGPWIVDELRGMPFDCHATFRTFPAAAPAADGLEFIVGSCRYPGLLWKTKKADEIFGPIATQVADGDATNARVRFVMMVGDQIYADELNRLIPIGRADSEAEFQERYVTAFGSPNMRRLLRSVPTYMILDDHEIEDNWTQDRVQKQSRLFNTAISAYMSYQWSHGPRTWGRLLYYTFDCAGYPFFVLDTRTQRYKDDDPDTVDDNHVIGRPSLDPVHEPSQETCLIGWLRTQQETRGDVPKFIVTSSVFVPNDLGERWGTEAPLDDPNQPKRRRRLESSDSWPAFPRTRRTILEAIVEHGVQNVVFLSGDIHCSNVAEMRFTDAGGARLPLKAFSVTSSAFYWPFPFADGDPANYVHDSTLPGQNDSFPLGNGVRMDYTATKFTQVDNFCRLGIDRATHRLHVTVYDVDGKVVTTAAKEPLESEFVLAPWPAVFTP